MTDSGNSLSCAVRIELDHASMSATASELTEWWLTAREKSRMLWPDVRDEIPYSLYMISVFKEDFTASRILAWGKGYCVQKAVLLAALARAAGIPARLAFARIRNHKAPAKIVALTGTNIFPRHGYTQLFLEGTWVSMAPTFDSTLCAKIGVPVVEWDGQTDATLPLEDLNGGKYIEYVEKFGHYADLPFDWIVAETSKTVGKDKRPWLSREDITRGL